VIPKPHILRERLEMMPVHQLRPENGQPALRQLGKPAVKFRRYRKLKHRIAQKFEPLIVGRPLTLFVAEGGMRQSKAQKGRVRKRVTETLLKIVEA